MCLNFDPAESEKLIEELKSAGNIVYALKVLRLINNIDYNEYYKQSVYIQYPLFYPQSSYKTVLCSLLHREMWEIDKEKTSNRESPTLTNQEIGKREINHGLHFFTTWKSWEYYKHHINAYSQCVLMEAQINPQDLLAFGYADGEPSCVAHKARIIKFLDYSTHATVCHR